jgi:hypothetical protein
MSGLFGGGGSSKKKRDEGYIPPAGQVPEADPEQRFPAPGAKPASSPSLVGGLEGFGSTSLADESTKTPGSMWG